MECCYPVDCGQYAVTPVLMAPGYPAKYCEDPPMCYPCLPRCTQGHIAYGCEQKTKSISRIPPDQHHMENECNRHQNQRQRSSTLSRQFKRSPTSASNSPNTNNCQPPPNYCPTCYQPTCKPVKTKYVIPCYRYEDGRIVHKFPVTAFKRNGMQDQEHSKLLGAANFLIRCPRDVSIECDVCTKPVKVGDPAKVPLCSTKPDLGCCLLRKKPIEVSLEDILDN